MLQPSAQTGGIVGLVGQQALWLSDGAEKRNSHDDVGDVSGGQRESDRSAAIIGQSMDLARPSARERPIASSISPFLSRSPSDAL
jgi:hypothetical protein